MASMRSSGFEIGPSPGPTRIKVAKGKVVIVHTAVLTDDDIWDVIWSSGPPTVWLVHNPHPKWG